MNDIKGIIEDVEKSSLVSDKVIKKVIEIIGQEEWNDIHDEEDDTCTTTGELIITLKGIAELEKENAELKEKVSYLEDNLRVARKDRENLQLKVAKGLKEFVKDFPATSIRYLANEKYVEENDELKEIIAKMNYVIIETFSNLTKAKSLLTKWIFDKPCTVSEQKDLISDTEQFLQEVSG